MGILTFVLIVLVAWTIYHLIPVLSGKEINYSKTKSKLQHIKTIGTFALVSGILGQLVGLYAAFSAVEEAGSVAPGILMGGLKVSTISTIYGILIFLLSLILWFVADFILSRKAN